MSSQSLPVPDPTLAARARRPWYGQFEDRLSKQLDVMAAAVVVVGFCWRVWLAQATFFNTDEAWHYSVANQNSLVAAYKASLTLAHPPLLMVILYFGKHLGRSDLMIRLPGVLAGAIFCWVFYKWLSVLFGQTVAWCGLVFASFLPPMVVLSAELRQYSWMLLFAVCAAYFLERALASNSARMMLWSSLCLWLALFSHYSAFLFAASLGIYALLRMILLRASSAVIASWSIGQAIGIGFGAILYVAQIAKLAAVYPGDPLQHFGDFYLSEAYFHAGKESLAHFLYRGTFGIFRFLCAQRTAGHLMTVLYLAGVILLDRQKKEESGQPPSRFMPLLLVLPFLVNWVAVVAGVYPYGRTRQCVFLAIFGIAGVSITLAKISPRREWLAVGMALAIVAACHLFGTPHSLDLLAVAEQKHEHMERAMEFIRSKVTPADILFTDKPTSFQLMHYLCGPKPVTVKPSAEGFDSFDCDGIRVISTDLAEGSLTPQSFPERLEEMERRYYLNPATSIWVVQAAWSIGLGETLRARSEEFSGIEPRVFDRYIEVFPLPRRATSPAVQPQAR